MATARSLTFTLTHEKSSALAQAAWIFAFAGLTALGAQVQIPHQPVPYTLQTFFVLLGAAFLGGRNGAVSQLLYVTVGCLGAPVFSGWSGGLSYLAGPTAGYLIGFPIAAVIVGTLIRLRQGYVWILASMFAGLVTIFACGTLVLNFGFIHDITKSVLSGFLIFSWWDMLKLFAAAAMYNSFARRYRSLPA
jgi:biotin transport system substrate-specific component